MNKMPLELSQLIDAFAPGDGLHETPVPGVYCIKVSKPARRTKERWRASLSIVAQGAKEIVLGRTVFRMAEGQYVATPIRLPVISRVASAADDKPFLCLLIDMDPLTISEVSSGLTNEKRERLNPSGQCSAGRRLIECWRRLFGWSDYFGRRRMRPFWEPW